MITFNSRFNQIDRVVYFIKPIGLSGPVKIGCSESPEKRRDALETWAPFRLEIVAEYPGNLLVERQFHAMFREQHSHREWFHWSPELQETINMIIAGHFDASALPHPRGLPNSVKRRPWSEIQKEQARARRAAPSKSEARAA